MRPPLFVPVNLTAPDVKSPPNTGVSSKVTIDIDNITYIDKITINLRQQIPTRQPGDFEKGATVKFCDRTIDIGMVLRMPNRTIALSEPVRLQKGLVDFSFENLSQFHLHLDIILDGRVEP